MRAASTVSNQEHLKYRVGFFRLPASDESLPVDTGRVGVVASDRACDRKCTGAKVAELADAPDLGSGGETHGGSSPPFRTSAPHSSRCGVLIICPAMGRSSGCREQRREEFGDALDQASLEFHI